jgi:hypothetical protein
MKSQSEKLLDQINTPEFKSQVPEVPYSFNDLRAARPFRDIQKRIDRDSNNHLDNHKSKNKKQYANEASGRQAGHNNSCIIKSFPRAGSERSYPQAYPLNGPDRCSPVSHNSLRQGNQVPCASSCSLSTSNNLSENKQEIQKLGNQCQKIEYSSPNDNPLVVSDDNNTLLPTLQDTIFQQPEFPYKTNKTKFTPKHLYNMLIEYSQTITTTEDLLDKYGIEYNSFLRVMRVHPEIREAYDSARRLKADAYGQAASKIWQEGISDNPIFYQTDRAGNMTLTAAAVRYMEVKALQYHRFAQIHETGSYVPVSKQESVNRNLSISLSAKIKGDFDLNTASPSDLINVIRGATRQ